MDINGLEEDLLLSQSEHLTRKEVLRRRANIINQLNRVYRDHYWFLMEELKNQYRQYYWEYGRSPFVEDEENNHNDSNNNNDRDCSMGVEENGSLNKNNGSANGNCFRNRCEVHGCKSNAMASTRFCHMHILSDSRQKLYKACKYAIKSSTSGPILCAKPILGAILPSYCPVHFQKIDKHILKALRQGGLNTSNKPFPKFHLVVAEYIREVKRRRRAAEKAYLVKAEDKDDISI